MSAPIPMLEEQLAVHAQPVVTGRVRLHKHISEHVEQVDLALSREDVEIQRVRVDRVVEQPEPPRQEGDVTIVPLHAEVLTTQLVVTEELHIRRRQSKTHEPRQVTLRREELDVTRTQGRIGDGETAGNAAP